MRYFLEEGGCLVVAKTSGGLETIHVAAKERPDVLVLHEWIAAEWGGGYVAAVHGVSPLTRVVVVTASPEEAWSGPGRGADVFVEEWIGIQDLEFVLYKLQRPAPSEPAQVASGSKAVSATVTLATLKGAKHPTSRTSGDGRRPGRTWIAAAAAALILLVLFLGSGLVHIDRGPTSTSAGAAASLRNVDLALAVLVSKIRAGAPPELVLAAAHRLNQARAAAIKAGADIRDLDQAIASQLSSLLTTLPHGVAAKVGAILPTVPILLLPGRTTVEATSSRGAVVTYSAAACSHRRCHPTGVTCAPPSGSVFPLGPTTVVCSVTVADVTSSGSFPFVVQDTTAPTLALANAAAEATGPDGATVIYSAQASDTVDGTVAPVCSSASGTTFPLGSTTVTCSATDSRGNTSWGSLTVNVQDTTAPDLNIPADIVAEATSGSGRAVGFSASAQDIVEGSVLVTCDAASGDTFQVGTTTVTCSTTDAHGNSTRGSFTITVVDTTPPILNLPEDPTVEATGPDGAAVDFSTSAIDVVDGSVPVACDAASGDMFPVGTTTVTCSTTDAHGNPARGSFTITVEDTKPPILNLPKDRTVAATGPHGAAVDFSTSATDVVDGSIPVTCDATSGDRFPLGTTTVNCSATDAHGNTARGSFNITVEVDTTPPTLNLPGDLKVEATGPNGAAVDFSTSAIDVVDGSVSVTCDAASGDTFPLGTSTVNCSATDTHGNTARGSFDITVVDTTAPAIDAHPDITVTAQDSIGAVVNYTPPATHDVVDGDGVATCSPLPGTIFPIGDTIVTCTATDAAGNQSTPTTFVVHVIGN
jgi:HYR domain